jgi:hypothetical protein
MTFSTDDISTKTLYPNTNTNLGHMKQVHWCFTQYSKFNIKQFRCEHAKIFNDKRRRS